MYILLVLVATNWPNYALTSFSQEFSDLTSCGDAGKTFNVMATDLGQKARWICMPKGEKKNG
jgi:hypothetical protein